MRMQSRFLSVFLATSYLLAITTSGLFHEHGGHEAGQSRPGVHATDGDADHDCPVCQFLSHKPAAVEVVTVVDCTGIVRQVVPPAPSLRSADVFSAWQGRAPPEAA